MCATVNGIMSHHEFVGERISRSLPTSYATESIMTHMGLFLSLEQATSHFEAHARPHRADVAYHTRLSRILLRTCVPSTSHRDDERPGIVELVASRKRRQCGRGLWSRLWWNTGRLVLSAATCSSGEDETKVLFTRRRHLCIQLEDWCYQKRLVPVRGWNESLLHTSAPFVYTVGRVHDRNLMTIRTQVHSLLPGQVMAYVVSHS